MYRVYTTFFLLDEKEPKSQDKTICNTQATLLRVLSGLRTVFILRWLPKSGAGVHERCELDFFSIRRLAKCDKKKSSWRLFLPPTSWLKYALHLCPVYFFAAEKSMTKESINRKEI